MELNINITAEQIDELIRTRLVEAAIGKSITSYLQSALKMDSYDNPIRKGVDAAVKTAVQEVLEWPHHRATVRAAVEAVISTEVLEKVAAETARKIIKGEY